MPSQLHEVLASLFDERPSLAAEFLRDVLRVDWLPLDRRTPRLHQGGRS